MRDFLGEEVGELLLKDSHRVYAEITASCSGAELQECCFEAAVYQHHQTELL